MMEQPGYSVVDKSNVVGVDALLCGSWACPWIGRGVAATVEFLSLQLSLPASKMWAVMGEAIQQGHGYLGVAKYLTPFTGG